MSLVIDVAIEAENWASLEAPSQLAEAAIGAAIQRTTIVLPADAEVSILFCDDAFIRDLNRKWRGIDKPTNVLSFPTGGDPSSTPLLGDIVIAYETAAREALEAKKPLRDHVAHLLVHGFLHLIGYDHSEAAEAETMETHERAILAKLGISDPYRTCLIGEVVDANE
jgi:probable rRNA maturation factor